MAQRKVSPEEIRKAKLESVKMRALAGFIWGRLFDDGRCLYLAPSPRTPGKVYLGISRSMDTKAYYAAWEYEPGEAVWRAAIGWDGHGQPEGYLRPVITANVPS
jgi:hypothetical protein